MQLHIVFNVSSPSNSHLVIHPIRKHWSFLFTIFQTQQIHPKNTKAILSQRKSTVPLLTVGVFLSDYYAQMWLFRQGLNAACSFYMQISLTSWKILFRYESVDSSALNHKKSDFKLYLQWLLNTLIFSTYRVFP